MSDAAVNTGMQTSVRAPALNCLGYTVRSGIAGSYDSSILSLTFYRTSLLFSVVAPPTDNPTNSAYEFPFLRILTNFCYLVCF